MAEFNRPQVLILGCFHQAQDPPGPPHLPIPACFWNTHREAFGQLVKRIVEEHGVRLIGEEAHPATSTSAAKLAEANGIPYKNLDIPTEVQNQIRLRPAAGEDPATGRWKKYEDEDKYRKAWDNVREFHMFESFLDFQNGQSPSLLICGGAHQNGFRRLLRSRKYEVLLYVFDLTPDGETLIMEPAPEGGFNVRILEIPEICTFGATVKKAREMAHDAIRCYQESAAQIGEFVP
jgi:predicted RNase H-like HicB family nuclease